MILGQAFKGEGGRDVKFKHKQKAVSGFVLEIEFNSATFLTSNG